MLHPPCPPRTPQAIIGFAGRRVIEQTLQEQLPDDFQVRSKGEKKEHRRGGRWNRVLVNAALRGLRAGDGVRPARVVQVRGVKEHGMARPGVGAGLECRVV